MKQATHLTLDSISGSSKSLHISSCWTLLDFSVLIKKVQFRSMEDAMLHVVGQNYALQDSF